MSIYKDNVTIKDLDIWNKDINKELLFVYNYFKNIFSLNNEEIVHIVNLLFNNDNIIEISNEIINRILFEKYNYNKKIISKYFKDITFVNKCEQLLLLINKHNSYALFEDIDINNVIFFGSIWDKLHTNS